MEFVINLSWDDEALVWIATSEQITGLVLEADSLDLLVERVKSAVPDLLISNVIPFGLEVKLVFRFCCDLRT